MERIVQFRELARLGRDEFVAAIAPAVLLRAGVIDPELANISTEITVTLGVNMGVNRDGGELSDVYPLIKKPGAPFPEMITIGRTSNNDVAIPYHSVSRLHAYAKLIDGVWHLSDAGSKNGTFIDGERLASRKEQIIPNGSIVRLGDLELEFCLAASLYERLRP